MKNKFFIFIIGGIIICLMVFLNCLLYINNINKNDISIKTEETVFKDSCKENIFVNKLKEEKEDIKNENTDSEENVYEKPISVNDEENIDEESISINENLSSTATEESIEINNVDNSFIDYTSTSGLTQQGGVNYYNGRTETYYSSNVLYHYRTNEWTVDNEGFYRTDEGYYVVAASDMPQGTTFEGSKGTCIVLDSGCNVGVTDYYVAW